MELSIVDVAYGKGAGVARTPEGVVFVPGAFTGERVEAEITQRKKHFATAKLTRILEPSTDRIAPETEVVPGMVYAELAYPAEVALKDLQLRTLLQRLGGLHDLAFLREPVGSPITHHYRNKLTLHWDGRRLGYIGEDNKTVIDTPQCPLSDPAINTTLTQLRADRPLLKSLRPGTRLTFRASPDGQVLMGTPPRGRIHEAIGDLHLDVAADAFFQVNRAATALLLDAFKAQVDGARRVFDLYCGCGLFGLAAAQAGAREIFGLEVTPSAIESAKANAKHLGIAADYRCAPSEKLPANLPAADLWVVDPPRDGLSEVVRQHLLTHRPARVAYISCGPDTLARDLKALAPAYAIESMQLFDFFPRTAHFETLTFLTRT